MFEETRCEINQQEKKKYFLMANFPNLENKIKTNKEEAEFAPFFFSEFNCSLGNKVTSASI